MLSMQMASGKSRIIAEAARLLKPGGRYGIHELCLVPDDIHPGIGEAIARDLSSDIHVGVRPLTVGEWRALLNGGWLVAVVATQAVATLGSLLAPQLDAWRGAALFFRATYENMCPIAGELRSPVATCFVTAKR